MRQSRVRNIKGSIALKCRNKTQMQVSTEMPVLLQTHHTASSPALLPTPSLNPLPPPTFLPLLPLRSHICFPLYGLSHSHKLWLTKAVVLNVAFLLPKGYLPIYGDTLVVTTGEVLLASNRQRPVMPLTIS